jgi:hypothetical protein
VYMLNQYTNAKSHLHLNLKDGGEKERGRGRYNARPRILGSGYFPTVQGLCCSGFPMQPHVFMPTDGSGTLSRPPREHTKADKIAVRDEYAKIAELYMLSAMLSDFDLLNKLIDAMTCAAHTTRANGKT